ncbi:MAG: 2-oxoisovalerate dehydrogenase, component beta subunit [Candidatus Acidoferrum typicum]|nr:2-oxoisovalerate dehydrogenase, component beta subunit [Candidatus Acidoferrum typicum]
MDLPVMSEIVFDVIREDLGGYAADCSTEDMSVMADSWKELRESVKTAVQRHFHDGPKPVFVRLHLVRDDIISLE